MPKSIIPMAPVCALRANISAPAVINVIFELPLINQVMAFSTQTLHSSILVNLSESTLAVIFTDFQLEVDWAMVWGVSNDVLGVERTKLMPSFNAFSECLAVM